MKPTYKNICDTLSTIIFELSVGCASDAEMGVEQLRDLIKQYEATYPRSFSDAKGNNKLFRAILNGFEEADEAND